MTTNPNSPSHRPELSARIAERMARLRRDHNLSQNAMGAIVGTSQATVSRWEDPASQSSPSAEELATFAEHFDVEPAWLLGLRDHKTPLPIGDAVIDQALLSGFAAATSPDELRALLETDMSFGTIWVQLPEGAELVSVSDAVRRVRDVDKHVESIDLELWQRWARLVLQRA